MEKNILCGPQPTINYSLKYRSLGKFILDSLKLHGDRDCIVDAITKQTLTYKQFLHKTIQAAETLKSMGLTENDVVAISSENHINFYIPVIAAIYLGIPVAPLNHNFTKAELVHALNISQPKIVFCSSKVVNSFLEIREETPFVQYIVAIDSEVKQQSVESIDDFLKRCPVTTNVDNYEVKDFDPKEKIAFILCSSGTTGLPKGVSLTHYNFLIEVSILDEPLYVNNHDTVLGVLPFFHAYGLITIFCSINRGTNVIVLRKFTPETFLRSIEEYKISRIVIVPPIMVILAKSPLVNNYDLSSLREIFVGAAPLGKGIEEEVKKRLNIKDILQGYGLTEATLGVTKTPIGKSRTGASGLLVPHMKAKVYDTETGRALGVRQQGELCFKGPLIMKGYYGNLQATKQTVDEEGWLHTGDIGYYDEDGYFYIVDRIKELIKYKGFQVAPAELEYLLLNNPCVKDAAVIGKPDELAGELPLAFIVKEPGRNITAAQIQQYIAKQVAPQKRLHGGIIFVNEIPKNPSGKILRRKLKDILRSKSKL